VLRRFLLYSLFFPALALSQISNNAVTVTAAQNAASSPDQIVFAVTVSAGTDKGLTDILNAVSALGITAADLVSVGNTIPPNFTPPYPQFPGLAWSFQLTVPFSKMKDTTAALTSAVTTIGNNNSGLTLSFSVAGTQPAAQSSSCNFGSLVGNARTQAQQIGSGGGVIGGIVHGGATPLRANDAVRARLVLRTNACNWSNRDTRARGDTGFGFGFSFGQFAYDRSAGGHHGRVECSRYYRPQLQRRNHANRI
jgi:hypothetical protein